MLKGKGHRRRHHDGGLERLTCAQKASASLLALVGMRRHDQTPDSSPGSDAYCMDRSRIARRACAGPVRNHIIRHKSTMTIIDATDDARARDCTLLHAYASTPHELTKAKQPQGLDQ